MCKLRHIKVVASGRPHIHHFVFESDDFQKIKVFTFCWNKTFGNFSFLKCDL